MVRRIERFCDKLPSLSNQQVMCANCFDSRHSKSFLCALLEKRRRALAPPAHSFIHSPYSIHTACLPTYTHTTEMAKPPRMRAPQRAPPLALRASIPPTTHALTGPIRRPGRPMDPPLGLLGLLTTQSARPRPRAGPGHSALSSSAHLRPAHRTLTARRLRARLPRRAANATHSSRFNNHCGPMHQMRRRSTCPRCVLVRMPRLLVALSFLAPPNALALLPLCLELMESALQLGRKRRGLARCDARARRRPLFDPL